ncbi:hypothetical protein AOLI_G00067200 [Acnodon oligacanthus]
MAWFSVSSCLRLRFCSAFRSRVSWCLARSSIVANGCRSNPTQRRRSVIVPPQLEKGLAEEERPTMERPYSIAKEGYFSLGRGSSTAPSSFSSASDRSHEEPPNLPYQKGTESSLKNNLAKNMDMSVENLHLSIRKLVLREKNVGLIEKNMTEELDLREKNLDLREQNLALRTKLAEVLVQWKKTSDLREQNLAEKLNQREKNSDFRNVTVVSWRPVSSCREQPSDFKNTTAALSHSKYGSGLKKKSSYSDDDSGYG